jgi:hypothetical protein
MSISFVNENCLRHGSNPLELPRRALDTNDHRVELFILVTEFWLAWLMKRFEGAAIQDAHPPETSSVGEISFPFLLKLQRRTRTMPLRYSTRETGQSAG